MDYLIIRLIPQSVYNLVRFQPLNLLYICGAIVDKTGSQYPVIPIHTFHRCSYIKIAFYPDNADGKQALAVFQDGVRRAVIDSDGSSWLECKTYPALAA